ncbi:O-methyltransferase family protein [Mycobacterium kansasii 732]|uniref:Mitomycin biosynthesis 6-O-methyltransferase n=1 Tax=Mycobacterium pseudokansasii TaxID=2341080 RepID=A0A498QWG5_9MYCO|nr:O-methyltransferase family protein [Mycobacterium kansasii 732]VBA29750.1 Mitomycin biosynthesis 6-O-methyltransferase [Mycobacterium pseudokansasii]VBA31206.1 Mitomycin biosynthesis 6-O-methyltransferase [Mycobacterium pseudokansasii]VBA53968.1 Mitomycin biosynthesis 6-O-methyltransferase [Mycobacterium pseudokansasii]
MAAILTSAPQARGILFDLGHVVAGAPDLLSEHRVADRVRIEAGSFFDEIPTGGDAYVLKHIIHDWPDEDAVRILRNVRAAAAAGTKVLLIEQVIPPHDREFMGNGSTWRCCCSPTRANAPPTSTADSSGARAFA